MTIGGTVRYADIESQYRCRTEVHTEDIGSGSRF